MALHPDLQAEQAYIDHAYECLENARASASKLQTMVEVGQGGTEQARFEREVIYDTIVHRLSQLQLGDASLCFGRVDLEPAGAGETFYIGRLAVADERQEPLIVDWRAPVAEPFYRATGRDPMDLARRRHFSTRGRQLLGIEDELFGEHAIDLGEAAGINGHGALISALETARSGRLTDIVATIQGEQDRIIRSPLPGVLVVQGGPGTGKTVVALHRAAYLLYTDRRRYESGGVLIVGPSGVFMNYIARVLPSLGETAVALRSLGEVVDGVRATRHDEPAVAEVKGSARMEEVLRRT
ncbi:MAG TPA: DNA/RNA helicase domain-containing protein, partial [Acidimicrobiales bacterium]